MGKIFLRRTQTEHPVNPYILATDATDETEREVLQSELGDICVVPMFVDDGLVIGVSGGLKLGIRTPLGTAQIGKDLSQRVYDVVVKYGKKVANSMPDRYDFIDETGGPREIKFRTL
jgi:hypothetical protein